MKCLVLTVFFVLLPVMLFPQEAIKEEVTLDWWVVPLFAVDRDGNSVVDLQKPDLKLAVNNQMIDDFSLYRKPFIVSQKGTQPRSSIPIKSRKRMIFFVFDIAFSSLENMQRSKRVALDILDGASAETSFTVFTIDPFAGLMFMIGPVGNKGDVITIIDKHIVLNPNAKRIETIREVARMAQMSGTRGSKYTESDMSFILEDKSHALKNTNRKFFGSFDALYYALNSVEDNKFVYFFSEGISLFARKIIRHDDDEYRKLIGKAANDLSRSGAVLFVINPAGALESYLDEGSGEDPLRQLALESGGKYLEGEAGTISQRINNLHRAYYEIAFPEQSDFKGRVRTVSLSSTRDGVSIHTLHSLEKRKPYRESNAIEREIFALSLVNRNPFFEKTMILENLVINKRRRGKDREIFDIRIPDNWIETEIDLFKVWIQGEDGEVKIEKRQLVPGGENLLIELEIREHFSHYFTLINPRLNTAMVEGREVKRTEIPDFEKIPEIKPMSEHFTYSPELTAILKGAAGYCDRLRQAGFHYYCREKVVETFNMFFQDQVEDISTYESRAEALDVLAHSQPRLGFQRRMVNKYYYDYQIIKDRSGIREQRKLIRGGKKEKRDVKTGLQVQAFLSEKAVYAPFTLLAPERQPLYEYRFIKREKWKKKPCSIIEVLPRKKDDAQFIYGQVWIADDDFSVLKIRANPRSIAGYNKLLYIAKRLGSRLSLDLEIVFGVDHDGIRFPERVVLIELYKGGRLVYRDTRGKLSYRRIGPKGWERNRTEYTYSNYRFFEVEVQVSEPDQ